MPHKPHPHPFGGMQENKLACAESTAVHPSLMKHCLLQHPFAAEKRIRFHGALHVFRGKPLSFIALSRRKLCNHQHFGERLLVAQPGRAWTPNGPKHIKLPHRACQHQPSGSKAVRLLYSCNPRRQYLARPARWWRREFSCCIHGVPL